jgi:AraC-like DNA-binding protein
MTRTHRCPDCGNLTARITAGVDARPVEVRLLERIALEIDGCHEDCWRFFATLLQPDRLGASAAEFARDCGTHPTTLTTRARRAGLPSPKAYLDALFLVRVVARTEEGHLLTRIAADLECSSSQSFGKTVKRLTGRTARAWLRETSVEEQLDRFVAELIEPYRRQLRDWSPLDSWKVRPPPSIARSSRAVPPSYASLQ